MTGTRLNPDPRLVGIVGHEGAKFTPASEAVARNYIRRLLQRPGVEGVVSGHCHLGGIDLWAEEIGRELGKELLIFPPKTQSWLTGYKPRNLQIADACTSCVSIVVTRLPESFTGRDFGKRYHCHVDTHVKSGGCWTVKQAIRQGKYGWIHEIDQ